MAEITPEEARAYLERYRLLEEAEVSALRQTPMETRLRQLSALMSSRDVFGADPERERELEVVRARWARLRRASGV
ncbi:MAG: hypothetical protein AB7G76_06935 [Steroidobacteraceae bacterium]